MSNDFSHLHVEFYVDTIENPRKSAEEGRPIFDEMEMVKIRAAGDPKTVFVAPAKDQSSVQDTNTRRRLTYAELHHGPYEAFKANRVYIGDGTPLSEAPFLNTGKVRELQALNIHTVDQLAAIEGTALTRLGMNGRDLKNKAIAYLDKASAANAASENAELKRRLAELEDRFANEPPTLMDVSLSPFAEWQDEDIVNWIVDQGGDRPHHKCSHVTLVAKADELNASIALKLKAA